VTQQAANTLAVILGALGTVLILAGAFGVLAMNYALLLGIASYIAAGVVKKIKQVET
jgi:hypothetical protein